MACYKEVIYELSWVTIHKIKQTYVQGMRVLMKSFDQTWIGGLFWLAIGIENTFSASLMKYLYRRTTIGRTNTMHPISATFFIATF